VIKLNQIYTFYINGVEPDEGIWGCVAKTEEEAAAKARNAGLKDFFLSSVTDVPPESIYENALSTFLENPNLGPAWLPLAEGIALMNSGLTTRSAVWVMNTLLKSNDFSPENTPYCQALLESDGSLHVEVSGRLALKEMSEEDLKVLGFIGWNVPNLIEGEEDKEEGLPNPYRLFEVGWGSFQVAAFVLETLITVYGFRETDFIDVSTRIRASKIAEIDFLERVEIHPGNPDGTLFRLVQSEST
jgi:hypothetical protein